MSLFFYSKRLAALAINADGWMMDEWVAGWMMDGWMDGWMDG